MIGTANFIKYFVSKQMAFREQYYEVVILARSIIAILFLHSSLPNCSILGECFKRRPLIPKEKPWPWRSFVIGLKINLCPLFKTSEKIQLAYQIFIGFGISKKIFVFINYWKNSLTLEVMQFHLILLYYMKSSNCVLVHS